MKIRRSRRGGTVFAAGLFAAGAFATPRVASAAVYYYVNWTAANVAGGTASGTITLPDSSVVTVTFAALTADASTGSLYGAQINGVGTNYWNPTTPYISSQVENAPPTPDILQLSGGQSEVYTVTLSEAIEDPIMAIVSLGSGAKAITYDFDSPFTIVSQATGYFGGSSTALTVLANNVLQGMEGSGTIQFTGTFSTFSWTVPTPETWHGFTFGIRTTERLAEAGAPDAAADAGVSDAAVTDGGDAAASDSGAGPDADAASEAMAPVADAASEATAPLTDAEAAEAAAALDAEADAVAEAQAPVEDASDNNVDASQGSDATTPEVDASAGDSGTTSGGGCSCSTVGSGSHPEMLPIGGLLALAGLAASRRRKRNR